MFLREDINNCKSHWPSLCSQLCLCALVYLLTLNENMHTKQLGTISLPNVFLLPLIPALLPKSQAWGVEELTVGVSANHWWELVSWCAITPTPSPSGLVTLTHVWPWIQFPWWNKVQWPQCLLASCHSLWLLFCAGFTSSLFLLFPSLPMNYLHLHFCLWVCFRGNPN